MITEKVIGKFLVHFAISQAFYVNTLIRFGVQLHTDTGGFTIFHSLFSMKALSALCHPSYMWLCVVKYTVSQKTGPFSILT